MSNVRHQKTPMSQPAAQIEEARALVQAAWVTPDRRRFKRLLTWARKLLTPLATEGHGEAMWVLASLPVEGSAHSSPEEFDRLHRENARVAAEAGSPGAMFFLGCELDQEPTLKESTEYFRAAAELGHPYSKWCYGLNLLSGRGTAKAETLGLQYIRDAAEGNFEGAIHFMAHAYAQGTYGNLKNEEVSAQWWSRLKNPALIRY